jgi:RNA polymerase sigma-70 factor (ECF subfamily)
VTTGRAAQDPGARAGRIELRHLALRAGRGDGEALSELVRLTSRQVWWACAMLVDRDSADDLTQETYLQATRSLPGYRAEADPLRWLLTIARRACAREIGQRQRARQAAARLRARRPVTALEPALGVEMADAVARLAPVRRQAFVLTAVAGLSYAEAAAICGCPIGTIRSRVARARTDLIDALQQIAEPDELVVARAGGRSTTQRAR